MYAYLASKRRLLLSLLGGAAIAACSSTDRVDPLTGLKVPNDPRRGLIVANGSIDICKFAGPPGTYHFHIDVAGGGAYILAGGSPDNSVVFDGSTPSCWSQTYSTVTTDPNNPWAPGQTATITISETQLPTGVAVDSIEVTDGNGNPTSSVVAQSSIVITEGVADIHHVRFYNTALPSVSCTAINGVANQPLTPVTLTATGGSGGPYTFTATGLPTGVSISTGGVISGTPTSTGSFPYMVTVTDVKGHTATSQGCTLTVGDTPSANCVTINAIYNVPIAPVTFVGTGGTGGPYTFTATGLPTGITLSSSGTLSGTPQVTGAYNYTVTVTDKDNHSGTVNCSTTVATTPSASCVAIVAVQGVAIAPTKLTGSGGTGGPYTFSSNNMPAGLVLASDGTISGTPTASGTFNYTVTVTDKDGHTGSFNCSVTVQPPPSASCVAITAVQNVAITPVKLQGSGGVGGPYTFSSNNMPAGLVLASDGTISGTPTGSGTFSYTVTVTDAAGNSSTFNCSVTVSSPPTANCVSITAVQNVAITPVKLVGSGGAGGPYTFSSSNMPAGLNLASDGTISGTPTTSGTFNYTVTVTDAAGNKGTFNCSVTVQPPPSASCITINAVQNVGITPVKLIGSGGVGGPYTFSSSNMPAGLNLASDGTISGTPTASGTFNYTVTVTDAAGNKGTFNCSVTVQPPPSASCITINAVQNVAITPVKLVGTGGVGGPYTFSSSNMPAGLTLASDGTISGTPTSNGTFNYTVTVTDAAGNKGTFNCSVTVQPPPYASCVTIYAVQGTAITPTQLTGSGGAGGPYTFSATGLPSGLSISSSGLITGTPTASGTVTYTVTVTDKAGNKGTFQCTITVTSKPTCPTCVSITAVQGTAITPAQLTGTGGAGGPYTFTATGLPSGLYISSSGLITGTPTESGTFTYTVTIKDKAGNTGTFQCTVTVSPPPTCPSCVSVIAYKNVQITSAQVTGTGGTGGPYKFTATGLPSGLTISSGGVISGTPTVSGTFTYTVTVIDKDGHVGTFQCTLTVKTDSTPPVCSVYEDANPPYMSYQDANSGIVRLDVTANKNLNFKVQITPTPTGTTFSPSVPSQPYAMPVGEVIKFPAPVTDLIKVIGYKINTSVSSQLTVMATNAAGQTVSCDPISTEVTKLKQDGGVQEFDNIAYEEHFVRIENGGLRALVITVNGVDFNEKRLSDDQVLIVDISSAMKHNSKNTIILTPKGNKGDTADITIGPTGP